MTGFLGSLAIYIAVLGQQPAPQPESAAALVQELRALRVAVEQMLAANVRVQLLMGRLQLQETRILSLGRQSTDIEARLAGLRQERDGLVMQQKIFGMQQKVFGGVPDAIVDPKEREEAKQASEALAERLKEVDARYLALQGEQANIQQMIAAEQGRWGDFNQRLEELERLLGTVKR